MAKRIKWDVPLLKRLYLETGFSLKQIANEFNCDGSTVSRALRHLGVPLRTHSQAIKLRYTKGFTQRGPLNANWKGGRTISEGYAMIKLPNHHRAHLQNGYVFEHIVIWERVHNQSLPEGWVIHHLNGIRTDNRPQNLKALSRSAHINLGMIYKQRIRELEAEVKLLEKALEANQMIFRIEEN